MHPKSSLLSVAFLGFILISHAQQISAFDEKGKKIEMKVVETDPDHLENFNAGVEFLGAEFGNAVALGAGVDANYRPSTDLRLKANLFFSYVDSENSELAYRGPRKDRQDLRYNRFELSGTRYFHQKEAKKENVVMHLRSVDEMLIVTNAFLKTDIPYVVSYGLRLGYYYGQQSLGQVGKLQVKDSMMAVDGTRVIPTASSMVVHSLFFGYVRTKDFNFVVESAKFGQHQYRGSRTMYIDMMLGLFGTVYGYYNINAGAPNYSGSGSVPVKINSCMSRFGFRIGWDSIRRSSPGSLWGGRSSFEIGFRPFMTVKGATYPEMLSPFFLGFKLGMTRYSNL